MMEDLLASILEQLQNRYYGKYRGYVVDVDDPEKLGRIRVKIPRLLGDVPTGWCMPCAPYAGPDQGLFVLPPPGAGVWVEFEGGDLSRPIWVGAWWGKPTDADTTESDSTAAERRHDEETPWHGETDEEVRPQPHVRIWKGAAGHYVMLYDDPNAPRIEIQDHSKNNRLVLSRDGAEWNLTTERTVNTGRRDVTVDQDDILDVGGAQTIDVGSRDDHVHGDGVVHYDGDLREAVDGAKYERNITSDGLEELVGVPVTVDVKGSWTGKIRGAVDHQVSGGYGLSAGGSVNIGSGGALSLAATMPDLPSLDAVTVDAFLGNISMNTKLGMMRLGGMSATSPLVIGDGLMIHHTMLALMSRAFYPITALAYGPLMDTWATITPTMDWTLFAFTKRFPVG